MGRLLEALRADAGAASPAIPAIPATPAILEAEPSAAGAANRRIARIAETVKQKTESAPSPSEPDQTGRLLAALRDERLPDVLLSRDDSAPSQLAALDGPELRAYARALSRSAAMETGTPVVDYTQAALCEGCGPVWLWQGAPSRLRGCPWCFRRKAGKGFARPLVTCGECRHFLPGAINPAAGGGTCGLGLPYRRGEAGRWPDTLRECDEYRPRLLETPVKGEGK